jgi:tetratricopeptide (TPR) repeat protein
MRKSIIYFCFTIILFSFYLIYSVLSYTFTAYADGLTMDCKDIKYKGADSVVAFFDRTEHKLKLIGWINDEKDFLIATTKIKEDPFDGAGAITEGGCDGNTISVTIKQPFHMYSVTQVFQWNGKNLKQIKTLTGDYSQDLNHSALDKALKGDLEGAKSDLEGVMYPQNYLGCGTIKNYLKKGHKESYSIQKEALENTFELMVEADYESGDSKATISKPIPNRWMEIFNKCEISKSKYVAALNDYGFYLQQAGQNDKAAKILLLVVSEDPKRTVAYLNLADAYWGLGKKQPAIENYKRYEKLMINSKKADKIPATDKERLKANP